VCCGGTGKTLKPPIFIRIFIGVAANVAPFDIFCSGSCSVFLSSSRTPAKMRLAQRTK
jgi:hypothetical protein